MCFPSLVIFFEFRIWDWAFGSHPFFFYFFPSQESVALIFRLYNIASWHWEGKFLVWNFLYRKTERFYSEIFLSWTTSGGFLGDKRKPFENSHRELQSLEKIFENFFSWNFSKNLQRREVLNYNVHIRNTS